MIVHSSLITISAVCDEIISMDLQKCFSIFPQRQTQKSGQRTFPIWVPTPKIGVRVHITTDSKGTDIVDKDDPMIHPKIFKQIQKLCNHTFTWDACANKKGDNALCSQCCFVEDLFLTKYLKGEFLFG